MPPCSSRSAMLSASPARPAASAAHPFASCSVPRHATLDGADVVSAAGRVPCSGGDASARRRRTNGTFISGTSCLLILTCGGGSRPGGGPGIYYEPSGVHPTPPHFHPPSLPVRGRARHVSVRNPPDPPLHRVA